MPANTGIVVTGLPELIRAFSVADKALGRDLRKTLKEVGEPVRSDAEMLARAGIPKIGMAWSRMRVGVTTKTVYVAPVERGKASRANPGRRRPNLADLMMERAMKPALDRNLGEAEQRFGRLLDDVGKEWERA